MHYRKFYRPTVREALRAAREELGPSAVVLSTRMVPTPGLRGWLGARHVEVTAAVERTEVSAERIEPSANRPGGQARSVAARLEATGLAPALAAAVATHPTLQRRGAGAEAMRTALAETLRPLVADDEGASVEVFIGPPGAGKTTTIAKLAAQARARRSVRLGLVAADGFRVGAVEQLRLYADIIGAPFTVARSAPELARAVEGVRRPLLVDTAGRSPRDAGCAEMLAVLAGRAGVRRHLVLPATTPPDQARRVLDRFRPALPDRLVLTRLDEVETLAPLVDVLSRCELPLSYLAHGQNVPEDLTRATAAALAGWVIGEPAYGACA